MFGHIKPQSPSNKISESDNGDQRKVLTPVDEIKRTIIQVTYSVSSINISYRTLLTRMLKEVMM